MLAPRSTATGLMANSRVGCFRVQPPVDNIQQNRDPVTRSVAGAPLVGFVTRTYGNSIGNTIGNTMKNIYISIINKLCVTKVFILAS